MKELFNPNVYAVYVGKTLVYLSFSMTRAQEKAREKGGLCKAHPLEDDINCEVTE